MFWKVSTEKPDHLTNAHGDVAWAASDGLDWEIFVATRELPTCGDHIERFVISNRTAFFCPTCQPEGA